MYGELAAYAGIESVDALIDALGGLLTRAGLASNLSDMGVKQAMIPQMASEAAGQWTANFNPRAMDAEAFTGLYQATYAGEGYHSS